MTVPLKCHKFREKKALKEFIQNACNHLNRCFSRAFPKFQKKTTFDHILRELVPNDNSKQTLSNLFPKTATKRCYAEQELTFWNNTQ